MEQIIYEKGFIRYFDKDGEEIHAGDYVRFSPDGTPQEVYSYERDDGVIGLGTDATNPIWIEKGRAVPCEYGIYPFDDDDMEEIELCGRD